MFSPCRIRMASQVDLRAWRAAFRSYSGCGRKYCRSNIKRLRIMAKMRFALNSISNRRNRTYSCVDGSASINRRLAAVGMWSCGLVLAMAAISEASTSDYGVFTSSAGFDNDARHMIDPIGSARDDNGNLTINSGVRSGGGLASNCGLSSTAIGNMVSVTVDGSYNTIILNSNQINNGSVSATTSLNGSLKFGC